MSFNLLLPEDATWFPGVRTSLHNEWQAKTKIRSPDGKWDIPNATNGVRNAANGVRFVALFIPNVANEVRNAAFAIPNLTNGITKVPDGASPEVGFGGRAAVDAGHALRLNGGVGRRAG